MYNADLSYFGNTLIVFDGDVSDSQLEKIPAITRERLGNIIRLPGGKAPEQIIHEYILSLDGDHGFWSGIASTIGFTWDVFNEHGPHSSDYTCEKDRDKYKKWFNDHKQFFEQTKLMEHWVQDNPAIIEAFRNDFIKTHTQIAKRTAAFEIIPHK
jgi:hypothetical protein